MSRAFVIVGADTNVGKTVFAAALADALGAHYWKPVQAGLTPETDSQTVARLGGLSPDRIVPEAWRLPTPASPHIAARAAGVKIDVAALHPPQDIAHVIIETAGGVMVPLTEDFLTIDLLARWRLPTILVARTELGTINHSLLTLEALLYHVQQIHLLFLKCLVEVSRGFVVGQIERMLIVLEHLSFEGFKFGLCLLVEQSDLLHDFGPIVEKEVLYVVEDGFGDRGYLELVVLLVH